MINSTGDGASQPEASALSAEAQFLQMASNVEANHHGEEALYEGLATTSSSSLPADSEDER